MTVEESVQNSEVLLKQMSQEPKIVLGALSFAERERVVSVLQELDAEAAEARSEADLLYVANRVRRLVEGTPALAAQLSLPTRYPVGRRHISAANHQAVQRDSQYVQERAAQIRNRVVECHQELLWALQETAQRSRDDDE